MHWIKEPGSRTGCHCTDGVGDIFQRDERLRNGESGYDIAAGTCAHEDGVAVYPTVRCVDVGGIFDSIEFSGLIVL